MATAAPHLHVKSAWHPYRSPPSPPPPPPPPPPPSQQHSFAHTAAHTTAASTSTSTTSADEQFRLGCALHAAARRGDATAASAALDAGAPVAFRGGVFHEPPLHVACGRGCLTLARLLLASGADANQRCDRGNTALHEAAHGGSLCAARLLLEHTGVRVAARNKQGYTAERIARTERRGAVADYLAAAGETRRRRQQQEVREATIPAASAAVEEVSSTAGGSATGEAALSGEAAAEWFAAAFGEGGGGVTFGELGRSMRVARALAGCAPLAEACREAGRGEGVDDGVVLSAAEVLPLLVPGLSGGEAVMLVAEARRRCVLRRPQGGGSHTSSLVGTPQTAGLSVGPPRRPKGGHDVDEDDVDTTSWGDVVAARRGAEDDGCLRWSHRGGGGGSSSSCTRRLGRRDQSGGGSAAAALNSSSGGSRTPPPSYLLCPTGQGRRAAARGP